jgi:cytochrome b561
MKFEKSRALTPHQLLIFNLLVFNIFLPLMSLLNNLEKTLLPISLGISLLVLFFIRYRSKHIHKTPQINAQWHIVWRRCKVLLIAYCISVTIQLIGTLLASMNPDPKMTGIMMIAFSRIAIIPTMAVVTPLLIMSTLAMSKIRRTF